MPKNTAKDRVKSQIKRGKRFSVGTKGAVDADVVIRGGATGYHTFRKAKGEVLKKGGSKSGKMNIYRND